MKRLLVIGCGDVGMRVALLLRSRYRIYALTRNPDQLAALREHDIVPLTGDLDQPETLSGLSSLAHEVIHLAPPPAHGIADTRTAHLIAALGRGRSLPQHFIYISTSGVYGDCGGALIDETSPLRPQTDRARRRADAERRLRAWGTRTGVRVSILRVPGIYSADRLPVARIGLTADHIMRRGEARQPGFVTGDPAGTLWSRVSEIAMGAEADAKSGTEQGPV